MHFDSRFLEEVDKRAVVVFAETDETLDFGIRQHLGAQDAGSMRAVNGAALDADAVQGCLYDGILLGMDSAADFVPFPRGYIQLVPETPQFETILAAGGSAVVSGGKDVLVFNRHRSDVVTQAGRTLGDHGGNL